VQLPPPRDSGGGEANPKLIEPPFNDAIPSFDEELIPWE
jgi:hypothetical protein